MNAGEGTTTSMQPTAHDLEVVGEQLGRPARGVIAIPARDAAGNPTVVMTEPRLPGGTPFPTLYYLTSPLLVAAVSRLEAEGAMSGLQDRLGDDAELAAAYVRAHESYLFDREGISVVDEIAGVSAGGMPTRVKCLHALVGHALACGIGVNPIGDLVLGELAQEPKLAGCGLGAWKARATEKLVSKQD